MGKLDQIRAMREDDLFTEVGQLYRHFDETGQLLYVGQSLHAIARLAAHRKSRWFSQIARVDVETFPSKSVAEIAEREAIEKEKPLYNIVGNRKAKSMGQMPRRRRFDSSNAARQAKWRKANTELNRQRARDGMRKRRAKNNLK